MSRTRARATRSTGARDAEGRVTTFADGDGRTDGVPPFLGGMRGLTVFVQDVRNCTNKVRI